MQEKESIMGHRLEIGIFNLSDNRAVWYLGRALVPPGPVIPRVENADLKSMPIIDYHNLFQLEYFFFDTGYPHDGRADKDSYPHDGRADKDSYPHDRRADKNSYPNDNNIKFIIMVIVSIDKLASIII